MCTTANLLRSMGLVLVALPPCSSIVTSTSPTYPSQNSASSVDYGTGIFVMMVQNILRALMFLSNADSPVFCSLEIGSLFFRR